MTHAIAAPLVPASSPSPRRRLEHLDILRGWAILLVVGGHAYSYAAPLPGSQEEAIGFAYRAISTATVPAFFFCDGFLWARARERTPGQRGYALYLRRSARRLLWPWLVFTLIYTTSRGLSEAAGLFREHLVLGRSFLELGRAWWESSIAMQLYFLPSLFLIRCLTPLFTPLLRGSRLVPLLASVLWIVTYDRVGTTLGSDPLTQALSGLRYFLLGIAACRLPETVSAMAAPALAVWGLWTLFLVAWQPWPVPSYGFQFVSLFGAHAASLSLARHATTLAAVGRRTMGIYLLHAPPLMKSAQLVAARFPVGWIGRFALIWGISFALALLLTWLIERSAKGRILLFGESNESVVPS